jgi:tetratricopeptide (TPR) repeat protein
MVILGFMTGFRKRHLAAALALAASLLAPWAHAQPAADEAARLDRLFAQLAEPGRDDWKKIEAEIQRIWSHSGSPAMDLLLRRGNEAIEAGHHEVAIEHLTALTDHAPDFAEGWNARATAFYLEGEYTLSIADIERVLSLNPRHFGAMMGLATMLEAMGDDETALAALRTAHALNPNRDTLNRAIERLERQTGAADL